MLNVMPSRISRPFPLYCQRKEKSHISGGDMILERVEIVGFRVSTVCR